MRTLRSLVLIVLVGGAACQAPTAPVHPPQTLALAQTWVMQLNGVERVGAVDRLIAADADLVVMEATRTVRGQEDFNVAAVVRRIRQRSLCLAYINIGQAERYRRYWIEGEWRAPAPGQPGYPDFIVTTDPDGWAGNYPVAYWDKRWRTRLWGGPAALVDQAIADGFDGVYLDWVLGYREPAIVAAAQAAGVDPARAMAILIRDLRRYARRLSPRFLVIAQNGGPLAEEVPEFFGYVDAVSQESVNFYGRATASWGDAEAGDIPVPATGGWSTENHHQVLKKWTKRGIPVFVVDYTLKAPNQALAKQRNDAEGYRSFQSQTPLDRLP